MARTLLYFLVIVSSTWGHDFYSQTPAIGGKGPPAECYNEFRQPQRCIPEFENAAFGVQMDATNTCGDNSPTRYCIQTSAGTDQRICDECQRGQFSSYFLTDLHHELENQTWWQSDTMYENIQYPTSVNLTLHLGKAYDITYIRIVFYSPRPQSFVIYKRVSDDSEWLPYQYYSQSCRETYGLPESKAADRARETRPLCTSEYSDISPLKGGNVLFSTLEGRPSAFSFDSSPELQEWVTATDIRISLNRLNTFGDEIFKDEQVLRSYWYAIADVAVGARCKCNGHASRCDEYDDNGDRQRFCRCEHRTAGRDCERCEDFYNDAPWGRASQTNVHECKPCNCNGFSNRCFFDKELYERTGHGGHCIDCLENRAGANCERCKENYYQREDGLCQPCFCDATGSRSLQCNTAGKCQCKPGVTGDKCDECSPNFYGFTAQGCKECGCIEQGSYANTPTCDPASGTCFCKGNVEGKRCGQCKPGFFNLDMNNEFGCTPCFCYGHSSECDSAPDYTQVTLESQFVRSSERWTGQDQAHRTIPLQYNSNAQNIAVTSTSSDPLYFVAPDRFLGDQRASYNHDLLFNLRLGDESGYRPSQADVILDGAGKYVSINLFAQNNPAPNNLGVEYTFRLHEAPSYGWSPTLSTIDFMSILSNLTAIKIRGTYTRNGIGFLDNFRLQTAQRGVAGYSALWVEQCSCPEGYVGQFCESCAPGFRHSPANGGPFMMCIPCDCNQHASICDSETGLCICEHNTAGDNCELCAKGYYGNAITGTTNDCQPCPCPGNSACMQMMDQTIVCTECPAGYAGIKCDLCSDGYYGDPTGRYGPPSQCEPCNCNGNVDPNAVGNCNRTTGECLKCIYNTDGERCDRCLNGYYGDALAPTKGECRPCECNPVGTLETEEGPPQCNQLTGYCACRPHVTGRNCDNCQPGFFNIMSGEGCEPCNCNGDGSFNSTCEQLAGQCYCRPGVDGKECDQCKPYHYGFSSEGCQYCDCDESGSTNYQCDPSGQCTCQENVEGRRCDRCMENKQRRGDQSGCQDCPPCYNLVQDAVNQHRSDLEQLNLMLNNISKATTVVENVDFDSEIAQVKAELNALAAEASGSADAGGGGVSLADRVKQLGDRLAHVRELLANVEEASQEAELSTEESEANIHQAEGISEAARKELGSAADYLDGEGAAALAKAQNRSDQFGQQSTQMSLIAQESRLHADKLEKDAKKIKEIAESAYNTSLAANKLAKDGINKQNNISAELQILTSEMAAANGTLKNVQEIAGQALNRSKEVYDKALDAYVNVNSTQMPAIDAKGLQNNATELIKKAKELQGMIDELSEKYDEVLGELDEQLKRGRVLKEQGQDREADLQDIIARLDDIKGRAVELVNETNGNLQDAYEMHSTLKNFSNQMHESRRKAEAESQGIPAIEEKLAKVNELTGTLEEELRRANDTANQARDIARQAEKSSATQASEAASELRKKASSTRTEAIKLRDEADKLSGRVSETARRIDGLNKVAQENAQFTNDAKIKVAQAKTDAGEAERLVEQATKDLQYIMEELKNVQALNDTELDNLQMNLNRAENELTAADLAAKIEKLQAAKKAHLSWINDYEAEAGKLEAQVNNVKAIMEALPSGCFKKIRLEPL